MTVFVPEPTKCSGHKLENRQLPLDGRSRKQKTTCPCTITCNQCIDLSIMCSVLTQTVILIFLFQIKVSATYHFQSAVQIKREDHKRTLQLQGEATRFNIL